MHPPCTGRKWYSARAGEDPVRNPKRAKECTGSLRSYGQTFPRGGECRQGRRGRRDLGKFRFFGPLLVRGKAKGVVGFVGHFRIRKAPGSARSLDGKGGQNIFRIFGAIYVRLTRLLGPQIAKYRLKRAVARKVVGPGRSAVLTKAKGLPLSYSKVIFSDFSGKKLALCGSIDARSHRKTATAISRRRGRASLSSLRIPTEPSKPNPRTMRTGWGPETRTSYWQLMALIASTAKHAISLRQGRAFADPLRILEELFKRAGCTCLAGRCAAVRTSYNRSMALIGGPGR